MLKPQFTQVWEQLRSKRPHLDDFLEEVGLRNLRGIQDLTVRFTYPVSVLAGPNACGKSTVLYAAACAYKDPHRGLRDFFPSTMFPDFRSRDSDELSDSQRGSSLEFYYIKAAQRYRMRWARSLKNWNRSFLGLKGGSQPERAIYLRTLSNLSNPSDVRSILQLGRFQLRNEEVRASLIAFAQRILPLRYRRITQMSQGGKRDRDVLFAEREEPEEIRYSEFHMSSGERALLRLSRDVSQLQDALILIDEVEAGLHPFTQQQLMLELQRLALRNNLQVIVTTHSPVILETVPNEARIFLERSGSNVFVRPPYRDLIQNAFYGASLDKLSILCEDSVAEGILRGVLDVLNPRLNLAPADVEVGRDTGVDEFPQHVRALAKFQRLDDFIFVIDGDARSKEAQVRQAANDYGRPIRLLYLPGMESPEAWIWTRLVSDSDSYGPLLGLDANRLTVLLDQLQRTFDSATDSRSNIAKDRLATLADQLQRDVAELGRMVGRRESSKEDGEMKDFTEDLQRQIEAWRQSAAN